MTCLGMARLASVAGVGVALWVCGFAISNAAEIAVLDPNVVMQKAKAAKAAGQQIDSLRSAFQNEMQPAREEINRLGKVIGEQRDRMPRDEYERSVKELQIKAERYQTEISKREEKLATALNEATLQIATSMTAVVDEIKSQRKYDVVLTRSSIVGTTALPDITQEVISRLDVQLPTVKVEVPH